MNRRLTALLLGAMLALAGCGGTSSAPFALHLHNDMKIPVHVYQCTDVTGKCATTSAGNRLLIGGTLLASGRANLPNGWILQSDGAKQTWCLRLKFSAPPNDIPTFQLSAALPGTCIKS